jgi:hypothetical protein
MSAIGPKQTSLAAPHMSAFEGKVDIAFFRRKCLLLTQSGHRRRSAIGPRLLQVPDFQ